MVTKQQLQDKMKEINVENRLGGIDDMELFEEFYNCDEGYIADLIAEIGQDYVGIYYKDIFDQAYHLYVSGAYEDAQANGLCEGTNDLVIHLQMAWQEYNTSQLYQNIDGLIRNWTLNYLIKNNIDITVKQLDELLEELDCMDNNTELEEIVDLIEGITNEDEN